MQILKNIDNKRMSLTVTRIESQKEEIIEQRELREDEDFYSFHQDNNDNVANVGKVVEKAEPMEVKRQINNPFSRVREQPINETKKNVNAGGFSFGITVKRS
jgi:hypothetical protein